MNYVVPRSLCWVHILLLLLSFANVATSNYTEYTVTALPGYSGELPFALKTGYVGVGDYEEVQLFYYFVESSRSPSEDPLMVWITGGPGCSSLTGFMYENGPMGFTYTNYDGGLPSLHLNPYSWTDNLNMIFLDSPVGTGFSYSITNEGYGNVTDVVAAAQIYEFVQKWLIANPQYLTNQFYLGGDSYSGIPVPIAVQNIIDGRNAGDKPTINLKGFVLGNPKTDTFIETNSRISFAHGVNLIPDDIYEMAVSSCSGNYVDVNSTNSDCLVVLSFIDILVNGINLENIVEPTCSFAAPEPQVINENRRSLTGKSKGLPFQQLESPVLWCRNYDNKYCSIWANNITVQYALGVRPETKEVWQMCNNSLSYTKDITSTLGYYQNFTGTDLVALIYSGDHDMSIPSIGTQQWINTLNMTITDYWRAWMVDGQVAGYTRKWTDNDFILTFATLKGAGHFAAEYKPKEAYEMITRWLAYYPL